MIRLLRIEVSDDADERDPVRVIASFSAPRIDDDVVLLDTIPGL